MIMVFYIGHLQQLTTDVSSKKEALIEMHKAGGTITPHGSIDGLPRKQKCRPSRVGWVGGNSYSQEFADTCSEEEWENIVKLHEGKYYYKYS